MMRAEYKHKFDKKKMKVIEYNYLVMIGKYKKGMRKSNHYGIANVMSSYEEMKLLQNL
jgi:hypothetical protein